MKSLFSSINEKHSTAWSVQPRQHFTKEYPKSIFALFEIMCLIAVPSKSSLKSDFVDRSCGLYQIRVIEIACVSSRGSCRYPNQYMPQIVSQFSLNTFLICEKSSYIAFRVSC